MVRQSFYRRVGLVLVWGASFSWAAVEIGLAGDGEATTIRLGISRIDHDDLKRHVTTLASDALEGREAGARGGKAAIAYLRSTLKDIRQKNALPIETTQEFGHEFQNLLLFLPGSDETLRREVVVIGAHYDHVGYGKASNSRGPTGQIHNGADDNASGTAALLELIDAFSSMETPPPRSILFAFWDAEETGLLGSKHWVSHPSIPLSQVRFVLNLDMLGRLREGRIVTVGWRTAPGLRSLIASNNTTNELFFAFQPNIVADSDHYSFYSVGIPVIHIDTDKHDDYHRPSDDPDKVNWDGLRQITEFSYRFISDISSRPELPRFRRDSMSEPAPKWINPREAQTAPIRLGVAWDQDLWRQNIAAISQVNPNSPAANAGLRSGDRIVRLGPWKNGTTDDLKTTLQMVKNPVPIRIERPGQSSPIDANVFLQGTPVRLGAGWIEDPVLPHCVAITHVIADSPADRAEIQAGDVIVEMGGRPIGSAEQLRESILTETGPFHFRIERNGRIREVTVHLPDESAAPSVSSQNP